jgi:hypothetical protein
MGMTTFCMKLVSVFETGLAEDGRFLIGVKARAKARH